MTVNPTGVPRVTLLPAADREDEPWRNGGGSTRQIAARGGPGGWRWRISMARVEADGPFSLFPEVTRTILVMDGDEMELDIAGTRVRLGSEPFTFDGAAVTHGALLASAVTDFNVMVRRGEFTATTERMPAGRSPLAVTGRTGSPSTVIVVAPAAGAQLEVEQLGLDAALAGYDAVMIEEVTMPLHGMLTSPGSGVLVVLAPERAVGARESGEIAGSYTGTPAI
jgi:environmental stress-induced protein Ves